MRFGRFSKRLLVPRARVAFGMAAARSSLASSGVADYLFETGTAAVWVA
jgi:hypothetical protein